MDRDEILRVLRAFEASGLVCVLIGTTAMGFHGVVRATEDLALLIRAPLGRAITKMRLRCASASTQRRRELTCQCKSSARSKK